MPHNYVIQVLGKLPGLFSPKRYLYHCVRCKWSFVVNDTRRGVVTAVATDGRPLQIDEAARRLVTFHLGPCPELEALALETSRRPQIEPETAVGRFSYSPTPMRRA